MTTYTVDLTPTLLNPNSEGYLDSAVVSGNSIQRTMYVEILNGTARKVYSRTATDGASINDTMQTPVTYWSNLS